MSRDTNKAICRRFIQQLYNEGNLSSIRASVRDFVAPDAIHHELDEMTLSSGSNPERLADMIHLYRIAFPDLRVEVQEQIAETDRVVTRLRLQGTQSGRLFGIGKSGKTVDITGIRIDRMAEGKIAESWFEWDSLGMLQQIGALPPLARNPQAAPQVKETAPLPVQILFPAAPSRAEMPRSSSARLKPAA
jgi:predicted ester cyclase